MLAEGLVIMLVGMGVVFLFLGILWVLIVVLRGSPEAPALADRTPAAALPDDGAARAAAVAVALALAAPREAALAPGAAPRAAWRLAGWLREARSMTALADRRARGGRR